MKALKGTAIKYISFIFVLTIIFCNFGLYNYVDAKESTKSKHVLILNSYSRGFKWSDGLDNAITKTLTNNDLNTNVKIEYMDTRFKSSNEYYKMLFELYKYKYKNFKFNLIISTDNSAFDFLIKYGKKLFPNIPKVFCGVNNFKKSMLKGTKDYTGIVENENIDDTIKGALKLQPHLKKAIFIRENTVTGDAIEKDLHSIESKYLNKISITTIRGTYIDEITKKLPKHDTKSFILLVGTFKDRRTGIISQGYSTKMISKACNLPIYTTWDFYLNDITVGGKLISSKQHGIEAALMGIRILNGEKASNIKIKYNPETKYIFNYKALTRYNIDFKRLPIGSTLINQPSREFHLSTADVIKIALVAIFIFIAVILILIRSIIYGEKGKKALIESEEKYRSLVELSPDCICIRTEEEILYANKAAAIKCGFNSPDEMKGYKFEDIFTPHVEDNKNFETGVKTLYETGEIAYVEEKLICNKNLKIIEVETAAKRFTYSGKPAYMIVFRDVTEKNKIKKVRKEIEENARKLKEAVAIENLKTEFLANVSHELRTPINVILGIVQIAELNYKKDLNYVTLKKHHSDILKQNCFRLIRIVNNLIDMTKIDSGYFEIKLLNYDIVKVIKNIVSSIDDYVSNKGLKITFDTEVDEKIIAIDPDMIERIMLNLFSNAIKFTESGGSIHVKVSEKEGFIVISVRDTGTGIEEEMQSKLFKRFIQADKSFTRNREGSGIGLSLIKSFVEMHNGTITLKSEFGKGSEFIISLPIKLVGNSEEGLINNTEVSGGIERINIEFSDIY